MIPSDVSSVPSPDYCRATVGDPEQHRPLRLLLDSTLLPGSSAGAPGPRKRRRLQGWELPTQPASLGKDSSQVASVDTKVICSTEMLGKGLDWTPSCWTSSLSITSNTQTESVLKLKWVLTLLSRGHAFGHRILSHSSYITLESGPNKSRQTQQLKMRVSTKH